MAAEPWAFLTKQHWAAQPTPHHERYESEHREPNRHRRAN
jgi:hypothetical protein